MFKRRALLLFLLIALTLKAFPATFVVTSNADSGPGTLRDALAQAAAADTTITNYITFNLNDLSEAGRTITLLTQLPDLPSNLVIDGSSQPGTVFGVSTAKIALFFNAVVGQSFSGLRLVNKHDILIKGLYIKNITDLSQQTTLYFWKGVEIIDSNNIRFGDASNGNVIVGFYIPLSTNWFNTGTQYCRNISIKNNFFNIEVDGETLLTDDETPLTLNNVAGQVKIGGTAAEGNVLAKGVTINQQNSYADYDTISAHFLIQNNKVGVDYLVQTSFPSSAGIYAGTVDPDGTNTIDILDNVITAGNGFGNAIFAINMGRKITILRNYIGTDKTLTKSFKTGGIFMYWDTQVAIGSTNPSDANYITNCAPVLIWPYTNATINKNSFFCTTGSQAMHYSGYGASNIPVVNISNIAANAVSGTATPNSSVELFYSDKCGTCSPQTYFASVLADNSGNWRYNGLLAGSVIASATLGNNTSDFTRTSINIDSIKIINACNNGNGSIKGMIPKSAQNIKWLDENGKIVGTSPDLLNVKIGKYKLLAQNGDCADSTNYFEIKNKFQLLTDSLKTVGVACGNATGSITGLQVLNNEYYQTPTFRWTDSNGKICGNTLSLTNLPAGSYKLTVMSADSTCSQVYGPVILKNTTGPNIDQSQVAIQSTNCGQSTGSITNLTVTGTGTIKYTWWNSNLQTVGTGKDLLNQPAGTYKLQVTDDTQCGAIYTTDLVIPETNGIIMDESQAITKFATCAGANGSVTGIRVTGATQYTWTDANQKVVSNAVDLSNAPTGYYSLTASNSYGCSKKSNLYYVVPIPATVYPVYGTNISPACPGQNTGFVNVITDNLVKGMRWEDNKGTTIGTGLQIENLASGVYKLYLTDQNGCETFYNSYTVPLLTILALVPGTARQVNDQCDLKTGSVTGVQVSGGLAPYAYSWTDSKGLVIANTKDLANVGKGDYTLKITDNSTCNFLVSQVYTILSNESFVTAPSVNNIQLCTPGAAIIVVNNPVANVVYRFYNSVSGGTPLDEQSSGKFKVNAIANTTCYISKLEGSCESDRTAVQVLVGLSAISIANTITPNGDGINDYWKITSIENYPNALVQVFSRYGEKVFEAKGYDHPFNGTYNGKQLPSGVYYYIINLNTSCSLLSGSLTIIR